MGGGKKTQQEMSILYQNIMSFLSKCNIRIILFYGTLLGYFRDENFIDMDDLVESCENLRKNEMIRELYLTGNPCTE